MDNGLEWLQLAKKEFKPDTKLELGYTHERALKKGNDALSKAKQTHDHLLDKRGPVTQTHRTFTVPFDAKLKKKKKYKNLKRQRVQKHQALLPLFKVNKELGNMNWNFMSICSNPPLTSWRNATHDQTLHCRFQHSSDAYLKLGPFKIEELNEEPIVLMFHDFLPETDSNELVSTASTSLRMSETGFAQEAKNDFKTRTSKQAWLYDQGWVPYNETIHKGNGKKIYYYPDLHYDETSIYDLPVINNFTEEFILSRINRRIELATQLNIRGIYSSEDYQVANYGLGGQYSTHCDPHDLYGKTTPHYVMTGDRFATFMTYLSDVQAGGGVDKLRSYVIVFATI